MAGIAEKVEDLIASSASFRSRTGTTTAALAKPFIDIRGIDAEHTDEFPRPRALIDAVASSHRTIRRAGYRSGTIKFLLEDAIPVLKQASHEDAYTDFMDWVESVLTEMMENQEDGAETHLLVQDITTEKPQRSTPQESEAGPISDYYQCWCTLTYGFGR